jgi:hypothetical protein
LLGSVKPSTVILGWDAWKVSPTLTTKITILEQQKMLNIKLNNLARTGSDFSTSCRKSGYILINIYANVKKYCTMELDPRENDKIHVYRL